MSSHCDVIVIGDVTVADIRDAFRHPFRDAS